MPAGWIALRHDHRVVGRLIAGVKLAADDERPVAVVDRLVIVHVTGQRIDRLANESALELVV